jgi:hypothetical protein
MTMIIVVVGLTYNILTQHTSYADLSQGQIKPKDKKILFHLYGKQNMTDEEKIEFLENSSDFRKQFKGKITSEVANQVWPNQEPQYSVDSNYIINFHLNHGNPNIGIGYSRKFAPNFNPVWGISLSPFDTAGMPRAITLDEYMSEAAHALQFYQSPFKFEFRYWGSEIRSGFTAMLTGNSYSSTYKFQYRDTGSIEFEAHQIIEPKLRKDYMDYRCIIFKEKINWVEAKLYETDQKRKKAKGKKLAKLELEMANLRVEWSKLVNGPLFH